MNVGDHSHDGHGVVVKHGRHVLRGEFVGGVADEQTCFAHRTVADDDAPRGESQHVSGDSVRLLQPQTSVRHETKTHLMVATTMMDDDGNDDGVPLWSQPTWEMLH